MLVVLAGDDQAAPATSALTAAGWTVRPAAAAHAWELLSALDRARAAADPASDSRPTAPGAVCGRREPDR